jgi:hypothetical protein
MKDEHQHDVDEVAIRKLVLEEWSRERIVKFCTHLMGDKCQECAAQQLKPEIPSKVDVHSHVSLTLKISDDFMVARDTIIECVYEYIERYINSGRPI